MLRAGGLLFRHRGWTPVPLLLAQFAWGERSDLLAGGLVLLFGELLRLWAVGHIGARSRTRTGEVGGLVETGPFGLCRNPLYVGNGLILMGVGLWSGPLWGLAWLLFVAVQYAAIVRWEEAVLLKKHGKSFQAYCDRVPRWWPLGSVSKKGRASWASAFKSERPTLTAIVAVSVLFWSPSFGG